MAAKKKVGKKQSAKKRAETIALRQQKEKEKVLEELEKMPIVEVAVKKAGSSSSTFYRWKQEDSIFSRAATEALNKGLQHMNDVAESKVISGIYGNDKTYVIFWLKNRHKNYTDKQHHTHEIPEHLPLTEERKEQIANAMRAWSESADEDEDELDSDYEVIHDNDVEPEPEVEEVEEEEEVVEHKPPPKKKSKIATKIVPKK